MQQRVHGHEGRKECRCGAHHCS